MRLVPRARRHVDRAVPHGRRGRDVQASGRAAAGAGARGVAGLKALAALVAAVAIGGAGFVVGYAVRGDGETATTLATTATVTTTTAGAVAALPEAVERTRAAIHDAAANGDYDELERLIPSSGFSYSFGGEVPGGAAAYWRELEAQGERPLETLAQILELPFSLRQGLYVWPFAFGTPRSELTAYERRLLGQLVSSYAGDDYYGWRAGIRPDGTWQFYVSGD